MVSSIFLSGSRLYGIETEQSDFDERGFYIAPASAYLGINYFLPKQTIESNVGKTDRVIYELLQFFELALKGTPNVQEILSIARHTDRRKFTLTTTLDEPTLYSMLCKLQTYSTSQRVIKAYEGYLYSNIKKIDKLSPKEISHIFRLIYQAISYLQEGYIANVRLTKEEADVVRQVKSNSVTDRTKKLAEQEYNKFKLVVDSKIALFTPEPNYKAANSQLKAIRGIFN